MKRFFLTLVIGSLLVGLTGQSCTGPVNDAAAQKDGTRPIVLNYWRAFEGEDTMRGIIDAYTKLHPNVSINYRQFSYDEYEQAILEGFAEDRGPDLFSIPNNQVDHYLSKIEPMPAVMKSVVKAKVKSGFQDKTIYSYQQTAGYTAEDVRNYFVKTVGDDVLRGEVGKEQIYGLPLSVDPLVLFYNRDLLNNAGIANPPQNWTEFADQVGKITVKNPDNDSIMLAGAAFGAGTNVQRAPDILASIMMQNGAKMSVENQVAFDAVPPNITAPGVYPSVDALRFYIDYASEGKATYTWSAAQPDSFDAFAQGRVAMFFGYSYHAAQLRDKAPRLRVGVVPIPQLQAGVANRVTAANYWVETVAKKSAEKATAWDFVRFAASADAVNKDFAVLDAQKKKSPAQNLAPAFTDLADIPVVSYLQATSKPTALNRLIASQARDGAMVPYVSELTYATNWYHGRDAKASEQAFVDMITEALGSRGGSVSDEASRLQAIVSKAAQAVRATY